MRISISFFSLMLFTIEPATDPTGPVTIPVQVLAPYAAEAEVSLDGSSFGTTVDVTFDITDGRMAKTVYVRGVQDDGQIDGDQPFVITLQPATSTVGSDHD